MPEKSVPGYISIVLIVLLGIFALLSYPYKFPTGKGGDCFVGQSPAENIVIKDFPIIAGRSDPPGQGGGLDPANFANYVLVRKDVPIKIDPDKKFDFTTEPNEHTVFYKNEIRDGKNYAVYYPGVAGEIDFYRVFKADYDNKKPSTGKNDQFRFRMEGFIFFVHLNPDLTPKLINNEIYTVDIYQEEQTYNNKTKDYKIDDVFKCQDGIYNPQVANPSPQNLSSSGQELQLEWFLFSNLAYMDAHCKPAIYLYPKEKTLINVKVKTSGFLTMTIPQYDADKGWSVWAQPDGALTTNYPLPTTNYPYLYYESKVPDELIRKPAKGWVVRFDDLENLYKDVLPKLGLNQKQTSDFVEYWSKALPPSPYYFVGVMDRQNIESFEPLEITPKPDSINRVRIYFERLDSPKQVEVPKLPTTNYQLQTSDSFRVIEWGGMIKNDKDHPFTCSQ